MSGRIVWSPKKRIRLNDGAPGNAYKENHMASPSQSNSISNRRESSEFDAELSTLLPPVSVQSAIIPVMEPFDEQLMLSIDFDAPLSRQPRSHQSLSTQDGEFDELAGLDVGELLNDELRVVQSPGGISTRLRVVRVPLDGVPGGVGMEVVEIETNKTRYITLTQGWLNMYSQNAIIPGDLVHLYVPAPETWHHDHYLLSDTVNTYPPPLLAVHPQFVFTGTAVSSTVGCNRKSFLLWLLTPPDEPSAAALPALVGSCVHELIQWGLPVKPTVKELQAKAVEFASGARIGLWQANKKDITDLLDLVFPRIPALHAFLNSQAAANLGNFMSAEEEITSDQLGLKGKLDLIVGTPSSARCVELKTGKPHVSHIGQVLIYHLLLTEKYGRAEQPELIYLDERGANHSPTVVSSRETINIMKARNHLAMHAIRETFPAPLPLNSKDCSMCQVRAECRLLAPHEMSEYVKTWWHIISQEEAADSGPLDIEDASARKNTSSTFKRMRGVLLALIAEKSDWQGILENPGNAKDGETLLSTQERHASRSLTAEQVEAVKRGLFAADTPGVLVNVCGFPGTGKSTLLAVIATLAALRGKRVLITAHTHSAVDNIITKITQVPVVRLSGRKEDVHPDCRKFCPPDFHHEQVGPFLANKQIFACTALGAHNPLLTGERKFDLLILDEAGQLAECALWAPLRLCRSAIQVGDPLQLPPLMKSQLASTDSFFVRSVRAGVNVVELVAQFRMNEKIMGLANQLYYSGRLRCGSAEVAHRKLNLDSVDAVWDSAHPLVFVSTHDPVGVATSLARVSGAAVLCPLKRDVAKVASSVQDIPSIEVMTIDKSQGRDWQIVIVVLNASAESQIMSETRRLNVALTRAKSKLIICGDRKENQELVGACQHLQALFLEY